MGDRRVSAGPLGMAMVLLLLAPQLSSAQAGQASPATSTATQNPFLGSVPTGEATSTPIPVHGELQICPEFREFLVLATMLRCAILRSFSSISSRPSSDSRVPAASVP